MSSWWKPSRVVRRICGLIPVIRDGGLTFRRWLAEHDRQVRAKAHREGYETARGDLVSDAFIGGPTYEALKESYTGRRIAAEAWDEGADHCRAKTHANYQPRLSNPYRAEVAEQ